MRPWFNSWVGKFPWRRDRLPTPVFLGFPSGSDSEGSACSTGDPGSIAGSGRSPGGGHGNLLQYSCLGNPHGQSSLAGYSLWGRKEMDTTEHLSTPRSQTSLCSGPSPPSKAVLSSPLFTPLVLRAQPSRVLLMELCFSSSQERPQALQSSRSSQKPAARP